MKKFIGLLIPNLFFAICANAQIDSFFSPKPRHRITIYTPNGEAKYGILIQTNDSSVFIYPGNFKEWEQQKIFPITVTPYTSIGKIETKQKGGTKILKGMLIGAGIGIAPVLIGAIFGESTGQAGAYISFLTVPLGTITGALVGGLSNKNFQIGGDKTKFQRFRKKAKK